jgi:hypothetical protein
MGQGRKPLSQYEFRYSGRFRENGWLLSCKYSPNPVPTVVRRLGTPLKSVTLPLPVTLRNGTTRAMSPSRNKRWMLSGT